MFFLFKQKTAYESRISDWSSDVCSSDLDVVSMARPLLADPDFVKKAAQGRADEINTCIACNQACLDHAFQLKMASCLVNPRACHETELNYTPAANRKRIAVVGAGPAGLATATWRAERGHTVEQNGRARGGEKGLLYVENSGAAV